MAYPSLGRLERWQFRKLRRGGRGGLDETRTTLATSTSDGGVKAILHVSEISTIAQLPPLRPIAATRSGLKLSATARCRRIGLRSKVAEFSSRQPFPRDKGVEFSSTDAIWNECRLLPFETSPGHSQGKTAGCWENFGFSFVVSPPNVVGAWKEIQTSGNPRCPERTWAIASRLKSTWPSRSEHLGASTGGSGEDRQRQGTQCQVVSHTCMPCRFGGKAHRIAGRQAHPYV